MSPMVHKQCYNSLFNITVKEQLKGLNKRNMKIDKLTENVGSVAAKKAEKREFVVDALN
jgi:hypothetical protein